MSGASGDTYNGWTNRETWAMALHLTNDECLYDEARRVVAAGTRRGRFGAADALEDWTRELLDGYGLGARETLTMLRDIGSLWRVDWREVAESLVAE